MNPNNRSRYHCSYITYTSWLTVDITLLSFAPMGDFLIDLTHSHPFMEMHYIKSGKIQIQVKDKTFILEEGTLFFINMHVPHKVISLSEEPPCIYNVAFLLNEAEPNDQVPGEWLEDERILVRPVLKYDYLIAEDSTNCADEIEHIIHTIDLGRRGDFVRVRGHLSSFLIASLQSFTKTLPNPKYPETILGDLSFKADKIMFYIRDHFREGLTLNSVAETLHYSPRQCQRIIQEFMGISFSELLLDLQLSYAKTLLCTTKQSLEEISMAAGFSSSRSFYRSFKLQEGMSPSQYRKMYQEQIMT